MGIDIAKKSKDIKIIEATFKVFFISLSIEILQYITGIGITDIDDLIFNTIGGLIGSWIYLKILKNISDIWTIGFLFFFGLIGILSIWVYQPNLIPINNIEYLNKEVLGSLKPSNSDYTGEILKINSDDIEFLIFISDTKKVKKKFKINDMDIFLSEKSIKYNSKGMIDKVIIKFKKIDFKRLINYTKENNNKVDIWVDQDFIDALILKI